MRGNGALQVVVTLLVVGGAVVAIGTPILIASLTRIDRDQAGRAREDERQRFAAHLHDSVLQTLALVQRQADDPAAVVRLARRQEHALRAWMAGEAELTSETLGAALREVVAAVEDEHGATFEVSIIGERPLDAAGEALAAAAREALRNACVHAPGAAVFVFAELSSEHAEVFVRDDGPGFRLRSGAGRATRHSRRTRRPDGRGRRLGDDRRRAGRGHGGRLAHRGAAVSERVRLVVVDDHQLFRAGVRAELSAHCDVVGEAATPAEALAVIAATRPQVVLLDVHLPDGGGVAVQRALAGEPEPPAVLALSVSDAAEDVVPMIRAGALGYVTKTIDYRRARRRDRARGRRRRVFQPAPGRLRPGRPSATSTRRRRTRTRCAP